MFGRYEVGSELKFSLSDLLSHGFGFLLAGLAVIVSLNVVEVGLAIWEFIPSWR